MMHRLPWLIAALTILPTCGDITHAQAPSQHIVVQNYYYALPGKSQEVYALRLHASDVRGSLGLPRGRVLYRKPDSKERSALPLPDVVWECEYATPAARESDVAALGRSEEFARVETRMDTLLRDFQRAIFTVSGE